jgi:hypothetical protein
MDIPMLHRFRRAMVRPDRERLKGVVEVDETYPVHQRQGRAHARGRPGRLVAPRAACWFYRLLQQALVTDPVTYESVVRPLPKTVKPA